MGDRLRGRVPQFGALVVMLLLIDAGITYLCAQWAYGIRITSGLLAYQGPRDPALYATFAQVSVLVWLASFWVFRLYRRDTLLGGTDEYRQIVKACAWGALALVVLSFWRRDEPDLSRGWVVTMLVLTICAHLWSRFGLRRLAYALRRRGWLTERVLIVGANDQGLAIARQWMGSETSGMRVVGFLDDFKPAGTAIIGSARVIGPASTLEVVARQLGVNEVVLVQNGVAWESFQEIINRSGSARGYRLRLSPGYYDVLSNNVTLTSKSMVPLFTLDDARIVGADAMLKAGIDYGLGAATLLLALPVTLLIALGLALRGRATPLLAWHRVHGLNRRVFRMPQFFLRPEARALGSVPMSHPLWLEHQIARRGLDKLPQLVSVLVGDMSLVGTRPHVAAADGLAPPPAAVRAVKPGVVGNYSFTTLGSADELDRDLYYVRNWTVWLDLQILWNSLMAVFGLRIIRIGGGQDNRT